jgi:hypothetical protein
MGNHRSTAKLMHPGQLARLRFTHRYTFSGRAAESERRCLNDRKIQITADDAAARVTSKPARPSVSQLTRHRPPPEADPIAHAPTTLHGTVGTRCGCACLARRSIGGGKRFLPGSSRRDVPTPLNVPAVLGTICRRRSSLAA